MISVKGSTCWPGDGVAVEVLAGKEVSACWYGDCVPVEVLAGMELSAGWCSDCVPAEVLAGAEMSVCDDVTGFQAGEVIVPVLLQAVRTRMQPNASKCIFDNRFILLRFST